MTEQHAQTDEALCVRTAAQFRVYPGEMATGLVTRALGLQPTTTQDVGAVYRNSLGLERRGKINAWILSSESQVNSLDFQVHLDWLLDRLMPAKTEIKSLQEHSGITMFVACIWWSASDGGGFALSPDEMGKLAALNLECQFDVSFYGDESNVENQERLV
jgi:hypothetical protein